MRYNGAGRPVRVPPFLDEVVDEDLSYAPGGPSWFGDIFVKFEREGKRASRTLVVVWYDARGGMGPGVMMFGAREAIFFTQSPPPAQKRAKRPNIAPRMGRI